MNKIKFLLCFALLVSGVEGRGQIYINSYAFGGQLLLDEYGANIASAYSLRLLDKDYTGNCITVRRVNNDTSVIGFSGNFLDTVALKTFCGTASTDTCWVRSWFDQSGNSRTVQQTTSANQPTILSGGVIVRKEGDVAVDFDGANDVLKRTGNYLSATSNASMFIVYSFDNATKATRDIIGGFSDNTGNRFDFMLVRQGSASGNTLDFYVEGDISIPISSYAITNTDKYLGSVHYTDNVRRLLYNDNVLRHTYTTNALGILDDATQFDIGAEIGLTAWLDGKILEFLVYSTDQNSNRNGIETNINNFYSIY